MLKIGCGSFPVARSRYFQTLKAVEITSTFSKLPRLATVEKWRTEAPAGFEFAMRAWKDITHPPAGTFRQGIKTELAWDQTRSVAEAMGARFVVFETPSSFYPDADHLRNMYKFFKSIRRDKLIFVWQPKGKWEQTLITKVCNDLALLQAVDPITAVTIPLNIMNYFRCAPASGMTFSEAEMREIQRRCGNVPSYIFFTHRNAWDDSRRMDSLVKTGRTAQIGY